MIYVTSDLHGFPLSGFLHLLSLAEFSGKDELIVLGDVIDRNGDGGIDLLRWMMVHSNVRLILGNHDFMARKKPFPNYIEYFRFLGFDEVYKGPLQFGNYILSHEPVFIEKESSLINIHGHTHEKKVCEDFFLSEYNKNYSKNSLNE